MYVVSIEGTDSCMSLSLADNSQVCKNAFSRRNFLIKTGGLPLSGNHTVTGYEMSGEPYSQKNGSINRSNSRIFQPLKSIHSVVLPVLANIALSLIGDWDRIVVVYLEGVRPPSPLSNIL